MRVRGKAEKCIVLFESVYALVSTSWCGSERSLSDGHPRTRSMAKRARGRDRQESRAKRARLATVGCRWRSSRTSDDKSPLGRTPPARKHARTQPRAFQHHAHIRRANTNSTIVETCYGHLFVAEHGPPQSCHVYQTVYRSPSSATWSAQNNTPLAQGKTERVGTCGDDSPQALLCLPALPLQSPIRLISELRKSQPLAPTSFANVTSVYRA